MKILTKENTRKEIENLALKIIMSKQEEFTMKEILLAVRSMCDENIKTEEIEEVVFNAFDFALSECYIDFVGQFTYFVDPIKQISFLNEETLSV